MPMLKFSLNKILPLLLAAAAAHAAPGPRADRVRWVMGTLCEVEAEAPDAAVSAAFAELERWDRILSVYKPESEVSALNAAAGAGPVRVSPELFAVVELALRRARDTGGAFDPTVLPLLRRGPEALGSVGWKKVLLDPSRRTVSLPAGGGLDFGGIGKGWALDRAGEALRRAGGGAARFNFGGQVLALGAPAGRDGWETTLPGGQVLMLRDASVAVSGDTERPGHIVSPFTGVRMHRDFAVAVLAPTAAEADGWSTALYVLGKNPPSFRGRSYFAPAAHKTSKEPSS
jgi:thiamine biosynthesis lipoprotein